MTTEILSLVVALLAVLVGPSVTYAVAKQGFGRSRELADRDDARKFLADAALVVMESEAVFDDLNSELERVRNEQSNATVFDAMSRKAVAQLRAMESTSAATRIRFGPREYLVNRLDFLTVEVRGLTELYRELAKTVQRAPVRRGRPRRKVTQEDFDRALGIRGSFDVARNEFLVAVQERVGVKLPDPNPEKYL